MVTRDLTCFEISKNGKNMLSLDVACCFHACMPYVAVLPLFLPLSPHLLLFYLAQESPSQMGLALLKVTSHLKGISPRHCCLFGSFTFLVEQQFERNWKLLPACQTTWTEALQHFTDSRPAAFQLDASREKTPQKALYPHPNPASAHLPQVSLLHYNISLALLACLQPLSQANHLQL